jgi:hypothetical protein
LKLSDSLVPLSLPTNLLDLRCCVARDSFHRIAADWRFLVPEGRGHYLGPGT